MATSPTISAAALIDAMVRLRPDAAPTLGRLADDVFTGRLSGPHAFSEAIQRSLGGTILLDALLLLHGAPMTSASSDGDGKLRARLLQHSLQCRACGQCPIPGCNEMRALVHTLAMHAKTCSQTGCSTCARWQGIQFAARGVTPPATLTAHAVAKPATAHVVATAQPVVALRVATELGEQKRPRSEAPRKERPARSALEVLARSALGELSVPSSPRDSPRNSPANSPMRVKRHRANGPDKARATTPLLRVSRAPANEPRPSNLVATLPV
jgi:hypothetical protein